MNMFTFTFKKMAKLLSFLFISLTFFKSKSLKYSIYLSNNENFPLILWLKTCDICGLYYGVLCLFQVYKLT